MHLVPHTDLTHKLGALEIGAAPGYDDAIIETSGLWAGATQHPVLCSTAAAAGCRRIADETLEAAGAPTTMSTTPNFGCPLPNTAVMCKR